MTAAVEQERRDALDVAAIDLLAVHDRTLSDMQHADDDGGQTGPFDPAADGKYLGAVLADPAQAAGAGIALGDGVGGDQPVGALLADEVERAAEEMGHEIGVAVAFLVDFLQPVGIVRGRCPAATEFLPANGGFPMIASNPGGFSCERFRPRALRLMAPARTPPGTRAPSGRGRGAGRPGGVRRAQPRN